ncbi:type II and III secretion system protein family protein [Bradyrhizobium sp. Tv2a-2]|uniref:type II and III secretion system protein family protein n=1 Tax=Bradyrhizobium sp. Tv2a-2 TaxID=113395 RepID=UPI0018DD3486|nr:type II and III secretion system protein family protein [Bradyrhizobium sp. Tv2a-2]
MTVSDRVSIWLAQRSCMSVMIGLCCISPGQTPAGAAEPTTVTAARSIQIEVSGGTLVRLPEGAGTEFIADPNIADIQAPKPSNIFIFGKKPGRTTLFVLTRDGAPLVAYKVDVRFPQAELDAQIHSDAGASGVRLRYTANGALLTGTVPDAKTAERLEQTAKLTLGPSVPLSNQLQVANSAQVNLRVRVAEVSRSISRELGFSWSAVLSTGGFSIGMQTGRLAGSVGGNPIASGLNGIFGGGASSNVNGTAVLDAMATEGLATILAEPNLTALSGSTATFLAGGEIPLPVPQALGTVSIDYKQFGVSVKFTPTVLSSGQISVNVRAEVSSLDAANAVQLNYDQIPALMTRRAETTLELASGQSFAIAGLIQNDNNNNVQKVPWLGDIPVLGALFRSTQFQRNQSELIIVVTPYVVRPTPPDRAPSDPSAYVRVPSDAEEVVYGRVAAPGKKFATPPVSPAENIAGYTFE